MKRLIFLLIAIVIIFGCEVTDTTSPDVAKPEIYVTYPGNWDTIYNQEITLSFEVLENNLDSAWVYLNGKMLFDFNESHFQTTINRDDYEPGLFTLYCKAKDKKGNMNISDITNFYWQDGNNPGSQLKVNLVRPIAWEEFETSEITVNFNVENSSPIEKLDVFIDGELKHTFFEAPFAETLNLENPGSHNIYATVLDSLGNSQDSELINFSIILPDTEKPNGFITSPADWTDVSDTFNVKISATDNNSVEKVELYIDGGYVADKNARPYNFEVDSTHLTNDKHTLHAKIFDEAGNFSFTQLINFTSVN